MFIILVDLASTDWDNSVLDVFPYTSTYSELIQDVWTSPYMSPSSEPCHVKPRWRIRAFPSVWHIVSIYWGILLDLEVIYSFIITRSTSKNAWPVVVDEPWDLQDWFQMHFTKSMIPMMSMISMTTSSKRFVWYSIVKQKCLQTGHKRQYHSWEWHPSVEHGITSLISNGWVGGVHSQRLRCRQRYG